MILSAFTHTCTFRVVKHGRLTSIPTRRSPPSLHTLTESFRFPFDILFEVGEEVGVAIVLFDSCIVRRISRSVRRNLIQTELKEPIIPDKE